MSDWEEGVTDREILSGNLGGRDLRFEEAIQFVLELSERKRAVAVAHDYLGFRFGVIAVQEGMVLRTVSGRAAEGEPAARMDTK